jgi:hypothetical protein
VLRGFWGSVGEELTSPSSERILEALRLLRQSACSVPDVCSSIEERFGAMIADLMSSDEPDTCYVATFVTGEIVLAKEYCDDAAVRAMVGPCEMVMFQGTFADRISFMFYYCRSLERFGPGSVMPFEHLLPHLCSFATEYDPDGLCYEDLEGMTVNDCEEVLRCLEFFSNLEAPACFPSMMDGNGSSWV